MMKELGYELHARIIWDKMNGIAPAFTVRFSCKYLLWFYKMAVYRCGKCKNKCAEQGKINLVCLRCKWQYEGQSAFDRKEDLFDENKDEGT